MKVPFSWLKDYVDIDISAEELQEKLFSCGFEVEELIYVGKEIDRCVVGLIKSVEKHPDADKLKICRIDCGEYGEDGLFVGVPCVIGANGVEEVVELPLTDEEKATFHACCDGIRHNMEHLKEI